MQIEREDGTRGGRYVARIDDDTAEATYGRLSSTAIIADHTFVPEDLRGHGIAEALITRMVEDARTDGVRIVPRCPYVDALRRRRPDWSDVFGD